MARDRFRLGGRVFAPLSRPTTLRHDRWVVERCRAAGLCPAEVRDDEDVEAAVRRLVDEMTMTSKGLELLGGMLAPRGMKPTDWTAKLAAETTAHLEDITNEKEKLLLARLQISMLMAFFAVGPAYFVTSKSSSREARPGDALSAAAATGTGAPSSTA